MDPLWNIWDIIDNIKNQLHNFDIWSIQHCYRESNKVVDNLANWGVNCDELTYINDNRHLPREARGEMNMDRLQMHSFRINLHQNSFILD